MQGNAKSFLKAVLLGFGLALLALGVALAQTQTPAGTQIRNQASASYVDSAGHPRTTTSNLVVTVVQQVYGFTITPNGSSESSPGQIMPAPIGGEVSFNYLVTNAGNGTDTINLSIVQGTADNFDLGSPAIYLDANCNGTLDSGENTPVSSVSLGMGQRACVIVRATIPSSATSGQHGNLNLVGTSVGDSSRTDSDNWARALATNQAALTAFKRASPTGPVTSGGTITYTITGSNVGGASAYPISLRIAGGSTLRGILIQDPIPNGLTVTRVSGSTSPSYLIYFLYYDGSVWNQLSSTTGLNLVGNGSTKVGMFIETTGAFFPPNASYTFSFEARVPTSAASGTVYANSAAVIYNDGTADRAVLTNTTFNVVFNYNVAVGPYEYPEGGATGSYDVGLYRVTRSGDQQTIAFVGSGTEVLFRHRLKNTGSSNDSFTLSFSGAPSGWSCFLVHDDLITPIRGPVGPVAANGTLDFALKCQVPASFTSTTPITLTVTATSVGDSSKSDTTTDVVSLVSAAYGVDLAKRGSAGDGDSTNDNPDPQTANPGQVVYFPIEVKNTGVFRSTFNLTYSAPSGWTVTFYPDGDCDGAMDSPNLAPVTNTGPIDTNRTKCFIAAVQVPAGTAPSANTVEFTATHSTVSTVTDTISTTVEVPFAAQLTLAPDHSGTVTSPGTIQYTHTLTNNSNVTLYCHVGGNGGSHGWTYEYSTDGRSWSPALDNVAVTANGGTQTIYVKLTTPDNQPIGRMDVNTVQARCFRTYPSNPLATTPDVQATATQITVIAGGLLRITKIAETYKDNTSTLRDSTGATALPGDTIVYTIEVQNTGTANLTNVRISDPIPAYTTFVSVSATIGAFPAGSRVLYSTNGTTWSATPPASVPTGGVVYVGVDTNNDGNITSVDIMPPGARIVIILRVRVR